MEFSPNVKINGASKKAFKNLSIQNVNQLPTMAWPVITLKYGTTTGGLPRKYTDYNDYKKWCKQLGGVYVDHTIGTRSGYALWGTTGQGTDDPDNWHWCSWYDQYDWYNKLITKNETHDDFITSLTCSNWINVYIFA